MRICVEIRCEAVVPAGYDTKLLEFESKTSSFPPSRLLFHPNHSFHSFLPHQNLDLAYLQLPKLHSR